MHANSAPAAILMVLAGCAPSPERPEPQAVVDAFQSAHAGVYEVYGLPMDRDALWERLDASFAGEALTEQYVEHWTSRHHMERERTAIDVKQVDYDTVEVLELGPESARLDVAWSVGGVVTHQRHKHPRVNRYRAVYVLHDMPQGWRIVQTHMKDVYRVQSPSRAGGVFDSLDGAPEAGGGYLDPLDLLEGGVGEDTGDPRDSDAPPVPADPFEALDGSP